ncbi:hypothetical protein B0J14DRAFT_102216 [Halenospora varia]|nr:hypothetical protein B0J14DRAFT_102216 [Halenospora varia]
MVTVITEEEHKNNINLPKTVVLDQWKGSDDDSDVSSDEEDKDFAVGDIDEDAPIESRLIQRLTVWLAQYRERTSAGASAVGSSDDTLYPQAVRSCKAKSMWHCENDLDGIASNTVLLELRRLTGCELIKSLNENMVYIGAREEENVHLALSKLDNIRKYATSSILIGHSFYSETLEDPLLAFKYILDVKVHRKRLFQMTLLDSVDCLQTESQDNFSLNRHYGVLKYALTVRCAPLDDNGKSVPHRNMKATLVIEDPENDGESQWHKFTFSRKGDPTSDPMRLLSGKKSTTAAVTAVPAIIQAPQSMTPTPPVVTPMPQVMDNTQVAEIAKWAIDVPEMDPEPMTPPIGKVLGRDLDLPPIAPEVPPRPQQLKPSWDTYKERSEDELRKMNAPMVPKKPALAENLAIKRNKVDKTLPAKAALMGFIPLQPQKPQSQKDRSENTSSKSSQTVRKNSQPANVWGNPLDSILDSPPRSSTALGSSKPSILDDDRSDIFNLSKYTPLPPTRPGVQERLPTGIMPAPAWGFPQISNTRSISEPKMERLIDFDDDEAEPSFSIFEPDNSSYSKEVLQAVDEVGTRRYHFTMNQKKPAQRNSKNNSNNTVRGGRVNPYNGRLELPSPPPGKTIQTAKPTPMLPDPVPEFCQEVSAYYEQLLQDLRGFRGQLTIQADFGCILMTGIYQGHVADGDSKDRVVSSQTVTSHLGPARNGAIQPSTFFTNKLTTLNSEAEFLVKMKDSQGEPLWESAACSWNIVYEFLYFDKKTGTSFTIEIDGETFNTQVKAHHSLGRLYIHGTKRHWDFKIEAKGAEILQIEEYRGLAGELEKSLYIPANSREPRLSFVLSNRYIDGFALNDVRVHQIGNYRSRDSESMLKVSKVQNLVVRRKKTADELSKVYVCFPFVTTAKPCEIHGQMSSWYEVSISSVKADELFKQNEILELGDEAGWSPESISKLNAAQALYLPACEMLKQMDGIGYHSDNGLNLEKAVDALKEAEQEQPVDFTMFQEKEKFW